MEVFLCGYFPGEHGLCFRPVLLDKQGEINVAHQTGDQSGGEKPMEKATIKYEIPPKAEKEEGKKVPKGFPENKACENQGQDVSGHGPVKEDLPGMVFPCHGVEFGNTEKVFEDRNYLSDFRKI